MENSADVGSLLRHLAAGFGTRGRGVDKPHGRGRRPLTSAMASHGEALEVVAVTLALMAQEAAAEHQYAEYRGALQHARPI